MSWTSNDLLGTLVYLLPGFITAWIFYALTCFKRPSEFERIIQALIYSVFVQAIVICIKGALISIGKHCFHVGMWSTDIQLVWSVFVALGFGLVASWLANGDRLHRVLRYLNITKQTSYPTEWYRNFFNFEGMVILDLVDERRIMGEVAEWPNEFSTGHFSLLHAHWIVNGELKRLETATSILVPAALVEFVEFMEVPRDDCEDSE